MWCVASHGTAGHDCAPFPAPDDWVTNVVPLGTATVGIENFGVVIFVYGIGGHAFGVPYCGGHTSGWLGSW